MATKKRKARKSTKARKAPKARKSTKSKVLGRHLTTKERSNFKKSGFAAKRNALLKACYAGKSVHIVAGHATKIKTALGLTKKRRAKRAKKAK